MRQSSITDWVQTSVVSLALVLAVYEFYISDRRDIEKRIERAAEYFSSSSRISQREAYSQLKSLFRPPKSEVDEDTAFRALDKIEKYLSDIALCYEHEICDSETVLKLFCRDLRSFYRVKQGVFEAYGVEGEVADGFHLPDTKFSNDCDL